MYNSELAQKEFIESGERLLMEKLSGKLNTVFDVGCNIGEWTKLTRENNKNAKIHMFEIMSKTYEKMLRNVNIDENIIPNGFGLGDRCGPLAMKYIESFDAMSTYVASMHNDNFVWKEGLIITGDNYVRSREIEYIDFLKIDTEGAEKMVLDGFTQTLKENKIGIIQFEYGFINVLTKFLLVDYYEFFKPLGYEIGKVTPEGITFSDYRLTDEDFKGPNYLAVHESKKYLYLS